MGFEMASRLAGAGIPVTAWNRTDHKASPLAELGAQIAPTPADAVDGADVVITMLSDPNAIDNVMFGAHGAAAAISREVTYIDMSTIGPDCFLRTCERLGDSVSALDAPVLGSVPQARDGTLDIFAGGSREVFDAHFDLLTQMGIPRYVGKSGSGASLKLVINSALVSLQCIFGEALSLGDAFGLEQTTILDALESSSLGPVVAKKRSNVETGDFSPRFTLDNGLKDAGLVVKAAGSHSIEMHVAGAALEWFRRASEKGLGQEDYSAVVKLIRWRPGS